MRECIGVATIGRHLDDMRHESPDRTRRSALDSHGTRLLRSLLASVSAMALMALSAGSASAQVNWTGNTSTDWTLGANWAGGVVPAPGQTVNIGVLGAPPTRETVLGLSGPVNVSVATTTIGNSGTAP